MELGGSDRAGGRAEAVIEALRLQPHPEGGWYREIHRSSVRVQPDDGRGERSAMTTIYFLLAEGETSRWHRMRSDEIWHLYEGGPLELLIAPPDLTRTERLVLGPALADGRPACTVPAGWWQTARPLGAYVLAGCTVGPGFEFEDFTLVDDEPAAAAVLRRLGGTG